MSHAPVTIVSKGPDRWMKYAIVFGFLLGALAGCSRLEAQGMSPGSIAETECLGGRVRTVVDAGIIGTDSMPEILAHEAVHREQAARAFPGCPRYTRVWTLLVDEVAAYCVSRPYRMARGYTKEEVNLNYIDRLTNQFRGVMPVGQIADAYRAGCA